MEFSFITGIIKSLASVVNTYNLTDKEKEQIKLDMNIVLLQHIDKIAEMQRDIIISEAKGNWLQRSWRPIIMLTFSAIVVLGVFIEIPLLTNSSPFWDIMQLGLGGYVIGRSAEKITTTIGKQLKNK